MKVYNGDATLESIAVMAQAQSEESNMLPIVTVYGCSRLVLRTDPFRIWYLECVYYTSTTPCRMEC